MAYASLPSFSWTKNTENSIRFHLGRFLISIINPIMFTLFTKDFGKMVGEDKIKLGQMLCTAKTKMKRIRQSITVGC